MSHLRTVFRSALRRLRFEPGGTLAIVATLGLGIGIVTLFFNAFDALVLRPLPFAQADQLLYVTEVQPRTGRKLYGVSAERFLDLRGAVSELGGLEAYDYEDFNLRAAGAPERVAGSRITAGLFPLLGVRPRIGRVFTEAEDRAGAAVVILGDNLWRRSFAADPRIVGKPVLVDGRQHVVIGVMPPDFAFPHWHQLWVPAGITPAAATGRRVQLMGRLAPGASLAAAEQAMTAVVGRQGAPGDTETSIGAFELHDEWLPPVTRTAAILMLGFAALVLLIVYANLIHLVLAAAEARRRQTAIARALGASQGQLLAQSAIDALVVVVPASGLALLLAQRASLGLHQLSAIPIPYWLRFELGSRAIAVGLVLALGSALLLGAIAAGAGLRSPLVGTLAGSRGGNGGGREGSRLRRGLVVAQYGFASFVLVGALLMWKSYEGLAHRSPGFAVDERVTMRVALSANAHAGVGARLDYLQRAQARLATLPEVRAVAAVSLLPISRDGWHATAVTTSGGENEGEAPLASLQAVSESYFDTLDIPLLAGRGFTATEVDEGLPVAVIGSRLAQHLWGSGGAVGRRLRSSSGGGTWLRVVGVAADVEPGESIAGVERAPADHLYVPLAARFANGSSPLPETPALVLATAATPERLAARIRDELGTVDPEVPIFDLQTMRRTLQQHYFAQHLWSRMFAAIALIALLIAAVGAYGVSAYAIGRRTRELGVRLALGAAPRRLLVSVLGQGLGLAGVGLGLGLLAAIPLGVAMARLLHSVELTQPAVIGGVTALLAAAALLATWAPALRASTVDPSESLRDR